VKVLGGTGVRFDRIETTWTGDDPSAHGGYGLYPVQSKNVVIEHCVASGASDAGIYLGQSDHAVIHDNEVHDNVAGIEVENTWFTDVHDNYAHDNSGGILVFALPGLQQMATHDVHVWANKIDSNNTKSFAAPGNTVGLVPRGTGFLVMAATEVEFDHNEISANETGRGCSSAAT
jgi:parallel beta-helix repeat protein